MPNASALYEVTSLVTRVGDSRKTVVESLIALTADTITITMRDPRTAEQIKIRVARELLPELPEAFERVCHRSG